MTNLLHTSTFILYTRIRLYHLCIERIYNSMAPKKTLLLFCVIINPSLLITMKQPKETSLNPAHKLLITAIDEGDTRLARQALLQGARIKTKSKNPNQLAPLHMAARQGNVSMVHTLLTCPLGGPRYMSHFALKEILPFLLCMHRLKTDNANKLLLPPKEIRQKICSYLLPSNQRLINFVPLEKLWTFNTFIGAQSQQEILCAVLKRHTNQHKHALLQKVKFLRKQRTPFEIAVRLKEKECAAYLDIKNMPLLAATIKDEYKKLLKMGD